MTWEINDRGFLPVEEPTELTGTDGRILEELGRNLPYWMASRRIREELVCGLRSLKAPDDPVEKFSGMGLERLFQLYSYFASSYVHATGENTSVRLPCEIAIPLTKLGTYLGRKPILSYASYCLTNWRKIDPKQCTELGNIELIQHFCHEEGKRDEAWFILVHVDIEAKAARGLLAISSLHKSNNDDDFRRILEDIHSSLNLMNQTLERMPEECDPDVYFKSVRPYIFGFNNVVYEGCGVEPLVLRGETGAQSSVIPAFQAALGITHKESMLTHHLRDMRYYMPAQHRLFLQSIELRNWRDSYKNLKEIYNECISEFVKFRNTHLKYAVEYIQKKVQNPTGTGGTPYIEWLSQLAKETEEFYM